MVDDLDTTKQSPIIRALLMTDTSVGRYGVDPVIGGVSGYSIWPPMTAGSEERIGCVTA